MNEKSEAAGATGPSHRMAEVGLTVLMIVFALIVIGGSLQVGIGWASDGPRAGFFPFYCGLFVFAASIFNLFAAFSVDARAGLFAEWGQLRQVLSVVVPSAIYVAIVPWVGMYLASALLIVVFMVWIGRYSLILALAIAVPVMIATFVVFERWFLVPLPKGPVEAYLGY
ncbi:MAG: tripartite tricarboxylate transporter TctB family protein [Bradyrhizobiaceae bacterium]|nr:tripartite tricarboxylate transporter TctB family protein [Bradyrhizobiaceae bacterium]